MNPTNLTNLLALVTLVASVPVFTQNTQKPAPTREAIIAAAQRVMQAAGFATMVTLDGMGTPQARIVDPFAPEPDLTVWIGTNVLTRKVTQIEADPRVTLVYFDPGTFSYVTLIGRAAVVKDAAERAKRWKDAWTSMYKDKNRGDDYVLVRVVPSQLEIVSQAQGMTSDPVTWRPVTLTLRK